LLSAQLVCHTIRLAAPDHSMQCRIARWQHGIAAG
jgi:hypothetical protein